jgi:hypothetical protein
MAEPTQDAVVVQLFPNDVTTRYQAAIRVAELARALYLEPNGTLTVGRRRRRKPRTPRAVFADALREWEELR